MKELQAKEVIMKHYFKIVLFAIVVFTRSLAHPLNGEGLKREESSCGYQSCPKSIKGKLNVHLVPHSHDDVGWLKTVDQYYYGKLSKIQLAGVQYIIDSVVKELLLDPKKKFIQVETAFLWKWWLEQDEKMQEDVKRLVRTGQLEMIGGAWSMNDEAATHYHSLIDQFTWGFRKLNDTFGECGRPRIGWQIDPFGHSREMASIMAQMGFDGLFFSRLDYQDKMQRVNTSNMEMVWEGSSILGDESNLFTSVLYNHYSAPPGFCFDVTCQDEPFIDNAQSPEYNVNTKVKKFIEFVEKQAKAYNTDHVIVTMGDDFNYQDATMNFKNLDKLIRYMNEQQTNGSRVNVFYSTPSCYLKAVNDANLTWPTKQDDFFPYASDPNAYWTGYFTSRPTSKYFERQGNNFLQVCKQLSTLAKVNPQEQSKVDSLREAMGIMQHHDAITGTEKQAVADDYTRILSEAFKDCGEVVETSVNNLFTLDRTHDKKRGVHLDIKSCLLLNISQCEITENLSNFVVTVYNPLSRIVSHYVRIPVTGAAYSVKHPDGTDQTVQLVPIPDAVVNMPNRTGNATKELVFRAQDIPPLGFRSYYVSLSNKTNNTEHLSRESDFTIGNKNFLLAIDEKTGIIKQYIIPNKTAIPCEQNFYYYQGYNGNNEEFINRSSGAYIFRPISSIPIKLADVVSFKVYKGDLVEEVHQVFTNWVSQVARVYKEENHVEFEWFVGPIPIHDHIGKEIVSRFTTDFETNKIFYTDSNGREMLKRTRNHRPTWNLSLSEPVAGNYYPVTSKIVIEDVKRHLRLAVLNDRAQGGSSLHDGVVELMIHRRLLHDDAFGVGEALNETEFERGLIARGKHFVIIQQELGDTNLHSKTVEQKLAQVKLLSPWLLFSSVNEMRFEKWSTSYNLEFSGLNTPLHSDVQILTLEPWKDNTVLLRLENIVDGTDIITVNLKEMFTPFVVKSACETTLGANQWLSESNRLTWNINNPYKLNNQIKTLPKLTPNTFSHECDQFSVTLTAKEIHTFILQIE